MKQFTRLTILLSICLGLALTAAAGPEPLSSGKEMKQVAPAPVPECNWSGFYIGLNVGGQWGHSEDQDLDGYNRGGPGHSWGYDESGVVAGGQVGYNFQWNWLLLGIEADGGYMDLDGSGVDPHAFSPDTRGESDSDFFTTIRGRLGIAFNKWLIYGTGGVIGVNYETRVVDDCNIRGTCGGDLIDAHEQDFNWGYTFGGGMEYMLGCHWTIKAEYLYFSLDDQDFSGIDDFGDRFHFSGETTGHIVRGGLNYKF